MLQKFRGLKDQCFGTTVGSGGQERSNEAAALTLASKERCFGLNTEDGRTKAESATIVSPSK